MEEVANLVSEIHCEQIGRTQLTPQQARELMFEHFERSGAIALAALEKGKVIGFAWMHEIFESELGIGEGKFSLELKPLFKERKRVFYIRDIGVKKELRGQGIGEKLLRELLEKGKKKGATTVVLSTYPDEKNPAFRLYLRIGFNPLSVQPPKESRKFYMACEY